MITKTTIQRIIDEARVEDVVGEFVTLKKRGANLLGLCPFHNEKTPSFNVNPARNIYKCFGCGKGGGPLQFLMDYQQLSYPDALKYLAKKYNIAIEEEHRSDEEKQKELEKHNLTESIYIANATAQKFFTDYMMHNEGGGIGLAYFKERGFLNHTIEKFQLGFAPDKGDAFTKYALDKGFQLEVLKKAGLTSPKEGSTYDFFRNRVMFPIHNATGKVVAFGGRIMVKDEKAPKYVNTPESEVYVKSKILYGLNFAKSEIRKKDECLLAEGYMDVISLHQAGFENAVASSGTSLTKEQIQIIKKMTNNITIIYDGDKAGLNAAIRGTTLMLQQDINTRILVLPDNEDPDSYLKKHGSDSLQSLISNAKDIITFILDFTEKDVANNVIKKNEVITALTENIASVSDPIKRSLYIRECSQKLNVQEQLLITDVNKKIQNFRNEQKTKVERTEQDVASNSRDLLLQNLVHKEQLVDIVSTVHILEREIIRLFIEFGNWNIFMDDADITVTAYMLDELEGMDIETPEYKAVFDVIKREFAQGNVHDDKFFTNNDDEKISSLAIELLTQPYHLSDNWWNKYKIVVPEKKATFIRDIQSSILRLKQYRNIAELRKVEGLIKTTTDEAELTKLLKLHRLLMEQKKEFARTVGNVIYRPTT